MLYLNSLGVPIPILSTGRSTGGYIIFYQGGTIDHGANVQGPYAQSFSQSYYNEACTAGVALAHSRMLIHELLIKNPDIVPEEDHLIILDSKYTVCLYKIGKDTKHTRHTGLREFYICQKFPLIMLARMI